MKETARADWREGGKERNGTKGEANNKAARRGGRLFKRTRTTNTTAKATRATPPTVPPTTNGTLTDNTKNK